MSTSSARAAAPMDAPALTAALERSFASPQYRAPTLPSVAMELMQLASRPDVKFQDVSGLLQRDPVLAARVLSIAQSAAYATRTPTISLHQAAVRLGLKTLREIVVEAALHVKVFCVPGYEDVMARLYRHSTATAHVTRAVCRRTLVSAEYAFMCGLLHDVGFAASLIVVSERREWRRIPLGVVYPVLDGLHASVSGLLARQWKLPAAIQEVVATHHAVTVEGKPRQVNAAIVLAEQLCAEAGAGLATPGDGPEAALDAVQPEALEEAQRVLKLDDAALAAVREEARELVAGLGKPAEAR